MSASSRARRTRERLGDRDIALLASLQEFRLMSGTQLQRLHFPGGQPVTQARKARATLRRLDELGLVVRSGRRVGGARSGSKGHVYGLSGLGNAVLDVVSPTSRKRRRVVSTKPAFEIHTLAVSELAVELREHEQAGLCEIDELRGEPGAWRWFAGIGGERRVLKPDTYVRLNIGDFQYSAFIEVDQDTESLPTIRRKLGVYIDYWRSGQEQQSRGVFPRVWWIVPDTQRLHAIRETITRLPADVRNLFTVALTSDASRRLIQQPTKGGD